MDTPKRLSVIGSTEYVEIFGIKNIPAKVDTGADSSAIWASNINMKKDGTLSFVLFDKESPFFTGDIIDTNDYRVKIIRSSHGDEQIRYHVKLPILINGKTLETKFTLADRSRNNFPVLIGRKTIKGKFVVDVAESAVGKKNNLYTPKLNSELKENPYEFHKKYIAKGGKP